MNLSVTEINQIKSFFADKPVKKVYLFGSYARGEADENSDVDLLIDWDYSKHIGLNYIFWREEIEKILHKEVDFVSADYIAPFIETYINNDKKLIYET
ncbi:MAG: nucleotidyltransferase [Flavobacterium sp.]|nr:nucleotidyltransferase [Flavobacterium sp.]